MYRIRLTAFIFLALLACAHASATITPIPASNADIELITERANAAKAFSANCDLECPVLDDCEQAQSLMYGLKENKIFLQGMLHWLEMAEKAHFEHFKSLLESEIITGENTANLQEAIAWHKFLHDMGSTLLDIASVASAVEDMVKGAARGDLPDPENFFDHIDGLYETLKDLESGMDTISSSLNDGNGTGTPLGDASTGLTGIDSVLGVDANDFKSHLSDLKNIRETALEGGPDNWRKVRDNFFKPDENGKRPGLEAIGQLAGRVAKSISKAKLAERQARLDDLMNTASAEARARAQAFVMRRQVLLRIEAAETAMAALDEAFAHIGPCMSQLCGTFSVDGEWAARRVDFLAKEATLAHSREGLASMDENLGRWGVILDALNKELEFMASKLVPVPKARNQCPGTIADDAIALGDLFTIEQDSPEWCNYGGTVTRPLGGPAVAGGDDDGDDPRDAPGSTPGGAPGTTPGQPQGDQPGTVTGPRPGGTGIGTGTGIATGQPGGGLATVPRPADDDDEDPRDTPTPDDGDDPRDVPGPTIIVKAKKTVLEGGVASTQPVAGTLIKLNFDDVPPLPLDGNTRNDQHHAALPVQGVTGDDGSVALTLPAGVPVPRGPVEIQAANMDSHIVKLGQPYRSGALPAELEPYVSQHWSAGGNHYATLLYPDTQKGRISFLLSMNQGKPQYAITGFEENFCRDKQADDPYFVAKGSWGQSWDDQWAIKRVGFTRDKSSAWRSLPRKLEPVTVAVIDTGLDWNHADLAWDNIWRNSREIPDNGVDDDNNGYVDDVIGWDFWYRSNQPWDRDGHGTFVAGVIAASSDNGLGIRGINPAARIMPLKALNNFGHTRASYVAEAIYYAADNGARIINLSVGGKELTRTEQEAIDHAIAKGVLVVVAAGNDGVAVDGWGPAGAQGVLTVGATDLKDKRTVFSNWGQAIDLSAPGVDVLSLRARRTDLMEGIPGIEYQTGSAVVGDDKRYYRASGTSFAAPIVAGTASLMLSANPKLDAASVTRMLLHSARDIETPGRDQYTGYGLLDAAAALKADPDFFVDAAIGGLATGRVNDRVVVQVTGTANADRFKTARIDLGSGDQPTQWQTVVTDIPSPVINGALGNIDAAFLRGSSQWTIRLVVTHKTGKEQEARFLLNLN